MINELITDFKDENRKSAKKQKIQKVNYTNKIF